MRSKLFTIILISFLSSFPKSAETKGPPATIQSSNGGRSKRIFGGYWGMLKGCVGLGVKNKSPEVELLEEHQRLQKHFPEAELMDILSTLQTTPKFNSKKQGLTVALDENDAERSPTILESTQLFKKKKRTREDPSAESTQVFKKKKMTTEETKIFEFKSEASAKIETKENRRKMKDKRKNNTKGNGKNENKGKKKRNEVKSVEVKGNSKKIKLMDNEEVRKEFLLQKYAQKLQKFHQFPNWKNNFLKLKSKIAQKHHLTDQFRYGFEFCHPEALEQLANEPRQESESWKLKHAIRLGLRQFFCDKFWQHGKLYEWEYNEFGEGTLPFARVTEFQRVFEGYKNPQFGIDTDFKFTVYYQSEFEELWNVFGVNPFELMQSLSAKELEGFANPAQSDSIFYHSNDGKYFLKSVQQNKDLFETFNFIEKHFFFTTAQESLMKKSKDKDIISKSFTNLPSFKSLPPDSPKFAEFFKDEADAKKDAKLRFEGGIADYYKYFMKKGNQSFLPKFFMLFRVQWIINGKLGTDKKCNFLFAIQNSIFPNSTPTIEYKFDLKGSTINRLLEVQEEVGKKGGIKEKVANIIWRDLNFASFPKREDFSEDMQPIGFFPDGIILGENAWKLFNASIRDDTEFLADHNILDYSLLLGVHFNDGTERIDAKNDRGYNAICRKCAKWQLDENGKIKLYTENGENLNEEGDKSIRVYFGIIDMLQPYMFKKVGEYMLKLVKWKDMVNKQKVFATPDAYSKYLPITIIPVDDYKNRFNDHMTEVVLKHTQPGMPPPPPPPPPSSPGRHSQPPSRTPAAEKQLSQKEVLLEAFEKMFDKLKERREENGRLDPEDLRRMEEYERLIEDMREAIETERKSMETHSHKKMLPFSKRNEQKAGEIFAMDDDMEMEELEAKNEENLEKMTGNSLNENFAFSSRNKGENVKIPMEIEKNTKNVENMDLDENGGNSNSPSNQMSDLDLQHSDADV